MRGGRWPDNRLDGLAATPLVPIRSVAKPRTCPWEPSPATVSDEPINPSAQDLRADVATTPTTILQCRYTTPVIRLSAGLRDKLEVAVNRGTASTAFGGGASCEERGKRCYGSEHFLLLLEIGAVFCRAVSRADRRSFAGACDVTVEELSDLAGPRRGHHRRPRGRCADNVAYVGPACLMIANC